jgi:hypothetical protein
VLYIQQCFYTPQVAQHELCVDVPGHLPDAAILATARAGGNASRILGSDNRIRQGLKITLGTDQPPYSPNIALLRYLFGPNYLHHSS